VLTGGPGAGKTAVLELVRQTFCQHVRVLPESAGIVFGGGFPRLADVRAREAAQRAIYYVQRELETIGDRPDAAVVLCDRGTLDGLAYWPDGLGSFLSSVGSTTEAELARYDAVIHLRTPPVEHGYGYRNPLRVETAAMAAEIDARIADAWARHPRRFVIPSSPEFIEKANRAIEILRAEVPPCCRPPHGSAGPPSTIA
jgi:hypothetical protein